MDEALFQRCLRCRVGHCGKADQAIFKQVDFDRVKTCDKHVESQIVLVSLDQMWLADVFGDDASSSFIDGLFLSDDSDAFAAAGSIRFHNVHVFEVACLSVDCPALVVLWENVSWWSYVKSFTVESSHPLYIPPHVVFPSDRPRPSKMINMLLLIEIAEPPLPKQASPYDVPSSACHMTEPCHLECIDHTVVCVRGVRHFEAWCAIRFKLLLVILHDARVVSRQLSLATQEGRVREKDVGLSTGEWALDHGNDLVGRPFEELFSDSKLSLFVSHHGIWLG